MWISSELTARQSFVDGLGDVNTQMGNYINGTSFDVVETTSADVIVRVVDNTASGNPESTDDNAGHGVISIPRRFVSNAGLMHHVGIHESLHTIGFGDARPGENVPSNCTASDTVMFHQTSESGPFPGLTCADTGSMGKTYRSDESPIVMNVYGGPIELSGPERGVFFDIAASGSKQLVAWPEDPSNVAFLASDRNGNGVIDSARELFGNHTLMQTGAEALNGYEGLKEFDSNGDGWVDAFDVAYDQLLLWFDFNRDGVSQADELLRLPEAGIAGLSVNYVQTGRIDPHGNLFRFNARVIKTQRSSIRSWDVYLRVWSSF